MRTVEETYGELRECAEKHFVVSDYRQHVRRILAATIDASVAGVSGPTCCDAIQGDLFFNQVMLDDLESIPNPSRQIKDVINYLKGRVDQGQADKGYCC